MKKIQQGTNELVVHQEVARLRGELTNTQRRGMNSLLKRGYDQYLADPSRKKFVIRTSQLLEDMAIEKYTMGGKSIVDYVAQPLNALWDKKFSWGTKENIHLRKFLQELDIDQEEVQFMFSDYVHERLEIFKNALIIKNFTLLQSFRSVYAGQLYKHIEAWKTQYEMILSTSDFKEFLGVPAKASYDRMEVLRRKVLNVAVDEINERSKINLTVELLRRDSDKRKVTHFKFRWGNNKIVEDTKKTQNSLFE